jgi:hypothetical protein
MIHDLIPILGSGDLYSKTLHASWQLSWNQRELLGIQLLRVFEPAILGKPSYPHRSLVTENLCRVYVRIVRPDLTTWDQTCWYSVSRSLFYL